mgnify:CR=1 FL=1|jgi:hypothetical protein
MTAKIKLNAASGGGSISIQAPSSSSNNRVISLPDIADGTLVTSQSTLDATKLSGNLPAISGANLTGISAGITMHDNWYINSALSPANGTHYITANWTRDTNTETGSIGSAMTESGGIFTFPSTGVYRIDFNGGYYLSASANYNYMGFGIFTTTDNSNYSKRIETYQSSYAMANNYIMTEACYVFDVTSTTLCKVRLSTISDGTGASVIDVGGRYGQVFFTRLGDT